MAASQRQRLRMSAEEVAAFIEAGRRAQVGTNDARGWPHVVPMSYFVDQGELLFWTDPESRKVRNLRADDRMTCLVEAGDRFEEFRAVQIFGRAKIINDYEQSVAAGKRLLSRYAGGHLQPDHEAYVVVLAHQRVILRLHAERIVSWDHAKGAVDAQSIGS